jgi:hypothetical protein
MQPHRRKKKKRPVLSYMRNIRSVEIQADDEGKFGFTLSGIYSLTAFFLSLLSIRPRHHQF